jgi:glucose/mannose-6-phosphate isomerase
MGKEEKARHYRIDGERMIDKVLELAGQVEKSWDTARDLGASLKGAASPVIVCGMGGSAIGGQMLADLAKMDSAVPICLERGYTLPAFVDEKTPVICVSYSGNTEEVLSSFEEALKRKSPLVAITSGGELAERAQKVGVPTHIVPGGMPPRAALGHLFTPLLRIASNVGLYEISDEEVVSAVRKLRDLSKRYSLDSDPAENSAMQLTKKLYGKIPLIYSGGGLLAGSAYRWKCQFNENSKCMAFNNIFSELGHNEIMGWESPERLREDFFVIMLKDGEDHPRIRKRMEITFRELEPLGGGGMQIESSGEKGRRGRLSRLFSILALGDFTSVYLAVEYGKDPTPIEKIEDIKEAMRSEDE